MIGGYLKLFKVEDTGDSDLILILKASLGKEEKHKVLDRLHELGVAAQLVSSYGKSVVVLKSDVSNMPAHFFNQIEGVDKVVRLGDGHPLASSTVPKTIKLSGSANPISIGDSQLPVFMAGPCSVESREQIIETALQVKAAGASVLRAGAFKPRTSPYEFQGLGADALEYLKEAKLKTGLLVVTEVMSVSQIESVLEVCDIVQVGTRNMYNYELLKEVGKLNTPVLLKRGMSATIDEFLFAAEYILKEGNQDVILCERGIRTFETRMRNTLDLSAVPMLKSLSGLPVVVDPSHATGLRSLIRPMSRAAIACGADGLLIETHLDPDKSISDAEQAISPDDLKTIIKEAYSIVLALSKDDHTGKEHMELASMQALSSAEEVRH